MKKNKDKYASLGERTEKRIKNNNLFPTSSYFNISNDIRLYKAKKGRNEIELLPFLVGKNHPDVVSGEIEIGTPDYLIDIWVHMGIGIDNGNYVCPHVNYNLPCPICEELKLMKDNGVDKKVYKRLFVKRRVMYNVLNHANEEVELFEVSHFLFAKELQEEIDACSEEGTIIVAHPVHGKTISFRAVEDSFTNEESNKRSEYLRYKKFELLEREERIDEEILEKAICLDDLLIIKSYDELKSILLQTDDKKDDDITKQKTKNKEYYEEEVDTKENRKYTRQKRKEDKNKDEEKCPYGHRFGVDTDKKDNVEDCDECNLWEDCDNEKHAE